MFQVSILPAYLSQTLGADASVAVALVLIIYDHFITFDQEVANVWLNREKGRLHKITFIMNRYFSEAVVAFIAYGMWYAANSDLLFHQDCLFT